MTEEKKIEHLTSIGKFVSLTLAILIVGAVIAVPLVIMFAIVNVWFTVPHIFLVSYLGGVISTVLVYLDNKNNIEKEIDETFDKEIEKFGKKFVDKEDE